MSAAVGVAAAAMAAGLTRDEAGQLWDILAVQEVPTQGAAAYDQLTAAITQIKTSRYEADRCGWTDPNAPGGATCTLSKGHPSGGWHSDIRAGRVWAQWRGGQPPTEAAT